MSVSVGEERAKESKAGRFFCDFQPVSVYRLRSARLTGAGYIRVCLVVAHANTHTHTSIQPYGL